MFVTLTHLPKMFSISRLSNAAKFLEYKGSCGLSIFTMNQDFSFDPDQQFMGSRWSIASLDTSIWSLSIMFGNLVWRFCWGNGTKNSILNFILGRKDYKETSGKVPLKINVEWHHSYLHCVPPFFLSCILSYLYLHWKYF